MYPRSAYFDNIIHQSHTMATRCDILQDGIPIQTLDIIEGNVTIDDVAIRRRASVSLADPTGDLVPNDIRDLLMPGGNEFKLWRGIAWRGWEKAVAKLADELLPLGVFTISDVQIEDSGQGLQINLDGFDRARKVARARMPALYWILPGTPYTTAIHDLLQFRMADIDLNLIETGAKTPSIVLEQGSDPWEAAQKMAAAIGYDLFFDPNGVCIMDQITDDNAANIDWTYQEGEQAMLLYTSRRIQDEGTYNHVIVTGETTDNTAPVRGEAFDNNPQSPTYYKGAYGDAPYFMTSSLVTTVEQANAAAARQLQKVKGFYERIETTSIVHPAHEIGDVIRLFRPGSKIDGIYIVDKLTIPMVHSRGMNLSTRSRQLPEYSI